MALRNRSLAATAAFVLALAFTAPGAAIAQTAGPEGALIAQGIHPAVSKALEQVAGYLRGITTLDARILQVSADGVAEGRLKIERPDKLRLEYKPPVPLLIVARGSFVMVFDSELYQTTFLPLGDTPVEFFLRGGEQIFDGLLVTNFSDDADFFQISLTKQNNPLVGEITLRFSKRPVALLSWRVKDAQGQEVEVALLEPHFGVPIDDNEFRMVDPRLDPRIKRGPFQ